MLFGNIVIVLFVAAQAVDGVLTYVGVTHFGIQAEGNPLLAQYMLSFGPGATLIGAKTMAVACGCLLHRREFHRSVGLLTLGYLIASAVPWARVLWP
jgi:hypothetical protein